MSESDPGTELGVPPTSPTPETGDNVSEDSGFDDDEDVKLEALAGKGKMEDKADDENKNLKKKIAGCCGVMCLIIALLVAVIFLFIPNTGPAARSQIDGTGVPTLSPTYFPTVATNAPTLSPVEETQVTNAPSSNGDTDFPTVSPTVSPTKFPTSFTTIDPGDGLTSRLPCEEIRIHPDVTEGNYGENNFKFYETNDELKCGDTFGGVDPERPNRNQWSVRYGRRDCPMMNYDDGFAHCDSVGARWCSLEEFFEEVALGTGCGGDRNFVWTNTNCVENGVPGKEMFDLGLRDERQPFRRCETDFETLSIVRCCGDVYSPDSLL